MTGSRTARRDWFFVLALTAIYLGVAFCWQDISYFDETFYMDSGARFHWMDLVHSLQFAPLYALWYRILGFVCPWPVARYFLSWGTLVVVAVCLPLWMRLRNPWLYAWLLICIPFFGTSSLAIVPYVQLFAACFLIAGACLISAHDLPMHEAVFAAFCACFLVSFARPEFAFFVPVTAVVYFAARRSTASPRSDSRARFQTCAVLALTAVMLVILRHGGGSRSGIAFAQHFNVRAAQNHLIPTGQDPWTSDYALRIFHVDMGNTAASTNATIFKFMQANPRLFAGHMLANLTSPITVVSGLIFLFVLSVPFWPAKFSREQARRLRTMAFYILLISLPSLISILLVFPDVHYFFTLLPVVLLYATQLIGAPAEPIARWQPWLLAAALPIVFLTTVGWTPLKQHQVTLPHPVRDTVACLQSLQHVPTASTGSIYDSVGVAPVLLGAPRPHVEMWDIPDWPAFQAWVESNRPSWVEVSPAVSRFYGVTDKELATYLLDRGYTAHSCPTLPRFTPLQVYVAAP